MANRTSIYGKIFLLVLAVWMTYAGVDALRSDTSNWPTTQGKVTSVEKSLTRDSLGTKLDAVTYEFKVNNKTINKTFDTDTNEYHQGDPITIFYDPGNPDNTVFARGENGLYGFIFLLIGLVCWGFLGRDVLKAFKNRSQSAS